METTTEMRWWFEGACPADVAAWFATLPEAIEDERRTDHYLRLPDRPDVGIKARAGVLLDVKVRVGRETDVSVAPRVTGHLERWTKWSFPVTDTRPTAEDLGEVAWVAAGKSRWLVTAGGCELELVETTFGGRQRSWGIAAEADGAGAEGRERLVGGLAWLAARGLPSAVALVAEHSRGYAEQLVLMGAQR